MELTLSTILADFITAFVVGFCWAILFGSPKRILWLAGLLGGLGHCLRFILIQFDLGLISATLAGSVLVGLLGIIAAHKVNSPPVVFTMPACITMIPGMYAYKTMLAGIKISDMEMLRENPSIMLEISHNLVLTMSLLFTLAIGISIGALIFRSTSLREMKLKGLISIKDRE